MDIAKCTADGKTYQATVFEALGDLENLRRQLICPSCNAPAFFRKTSISGQAACFGARPHAKGCALAALEGNRGGLNGLGQDEQINLGQLIEVDFAYGAHQATHPEPNDPIDPSGRGGRFSPGGGDRNPVMHRRLSTLLKNLMLSEQFRKSDQILRLPEGQFRVRDFFVEFGSAQHQRTEEYRGLWGMLSDARYGQDGSVWLNSGGRENVSVVVDHSIVENFKRRFCVDELEELAGAYILVFGTLKRSGNGKRYLACYDMRHITASLDD